MKIRILLLFCIFSSVLTAEEVDTSNFILLDKIEAVVFGEEAEIITKSDVDRPAIGGGFRTLDEIIFEKRVLLNAEKNHIPKDEETLNTFLAQIQREYNLSDKDLENIFTAAGYTEEEGRQQLQMMQMINSMLDIKIRSNLIVPRKDVEEYYKNNPQVIEATYTLERAFVPRKKMSHEQQYEILLKYSKTGKGISGITWSEPFTINHSDVAESKRFIYTMEPGKISAPLVVAGGYELFKLVSKTPESVKRLEESYQDIVNILRQPKFEELMAKYRDHLATKSTVVYF